jgi:rhodanese-related sulfurtransferase
MRAPAILNAADLRGLLDSPNPPRILDVRTPGEFEGVHIAGAYNVPLDLLREHSDEIRTHLDDHVVLVCRSGQRATQAEQTLHDTGLTNVHILDGGMNSWEANGFSVKRGAQRWDLERQVRLVAGSIVALSVLASIFVPGFKWVALFIGSGLVFAAVSNTCMMGMLLAKLPYNRGATCDAQTIVGQLVDSRSAQPGSR